MVIARLPLARRCIFRTEIKVYDAKRDLKPNFPRRDRTIARLIARDPAIHEVSLTLGISGVKSARKHLTVMDCLASSYFAEVLSRHFDFYYVLEFLHARTYICRCGIIKAIAINHRA